MVSSALVFNGVNVILAVVSLMSIYLVFKFVPDKRARILLIVAFLLIIFTGAIFSFCLKVAKMYEIADAGELFGKAPPGTRDKVVFIRNMAQIGNVFETLAIVLFAIVGKRLISARAAGKTGGEA